MRLRLLRLHWERLGRRDPCWAVLTHPTKQGGRWDVEQFFRTGTDELTAVLAEAERRGVPVTRSRALDFGCGAGRVTQAMAGQFDRADGVDISASMLRVARAHNQHADRCVYHLNTANDLALFEDDAFSFVYSTLVLQHMEPRYSRAYIRELLRVLQPGGLLVFQVPSHRVTAGRPADASHSRVSGRLPRAACRAHITARLVSPLLAGEPVAVSVIVENRSSHRWASLPDAFGRHQINVANHWLDEDQETVTRDDARCALPQDVEPGGRVELLFYPHAPSVNGTYWLDVDLVQENAGWFGERGSATTRIRCEITGGVPAQPRQPKAAQPVDDAPAERPFRERHPQAFAFMRATRVRDAYWAWRRTVDRVKRVQDRTIWRMRDETIWWLRDHVYQPVVPPLINWARRQSLAPRMEMHCVPGDDVRAILAQGRGRLVGVDEELTPGGYLSCKYWVSK
jgi:SAM-dependent methyltransferase